MQTRAEYQRARRAALASLDYTEVQSADQTVSVVESTEFDAIIATAQSEVAQLSAPAQLHRELLSRLSRKVTAAIPNLVTLQNVVIKHGRPSRNRTAQLVSLASVAATVAVATFGAGASGAAEIAYYAEEAVTIEAHALTIDAFGGDLVIARDGAASRASSRVDLVEALGEQLEFADTDTLAAAAEALSAAELLLVSESRATPELTEEIQAAAETLREAINLLMAVGEGDVTRAQEVLASLDMLISPEAAFLDSPVEAAAVNPEPEIGIARIAPFGLDGVEYEEMPVEVAEIETPAVPSDLEEIAEIGIDIANNATERVVNAISELELPIPVMEPRSLTSEEFVAVLIAEAQADGARLHATYAYSLEGQANGRIPESMLQTLTWAPTQMLRPDAATQLERLNEAYRLEFGTDLPITSTYRSFAGQMRARARSGAWAATPGTSNHGWGVAVDFTGGINRFGTPQHRWMQENAPAFGWVHPDWAQRGGRLPEPWHWEFWGTPDPITGERPSAGGNSLLGSGWMND